MGVKYYSNERFFHTWSPEMAYILGYLYADGSMEDASYLRGKYVRVTSIDQISIQKIKMALDSEHRIVTIPPDSLKRQTRYLLRIGSHKLFDDLIKLGLYPNKSLTVNFPKVPLKYFMHFVRGYFDGDGCVYIDTGNNGLGKIILKRLAVIFTSGSRTFLVGLERALRVNCKLSRRRIYKSRRSFQLRYSTADSVKIFKFFYRPHSINDLYLRRKYEVFTEYFGRRPQRIDKKVANILECLG